MGLFSRTQPNKDDNEEILDKVELPNSEDINDDFLATADDGAGFSAPTPPVSTAPTKAVPAYTIEDAIKLMQSLPQDNTEMVVTVVKKTLESTSINIQDILNDSIEKETLIQQQQDKLEKEIKQLQAKISDRNQRIDTLKEDLKTTISVRKRLQLAMDLEKKQSPSNGNGSTNSNNKKQPRRQDNAPSHKQGHSKGGVTKSTGNGAQKTAQSPQP